MKKILVPTDFTEFSNNAFRLATYIARMKGMSIKLLHIIEEPKFASYIPLLKGSKKSDSDYAEYEQNTTDHLRRMVALESANEIQVEYEVRKSKAGIAKEILREECDVIVMGRRREDNDEVLLVGSVAEKIVRLSSTPVITVGELPHGFQLKKLVFAADFEDESIAPVIQRVLDLARIFKAELHFLYVEINREFLSEEETKNKVKNLISKFDLQDHDVDVYFAPTEEEGISDYIYDTDPDLVALCTHGRTGIAHFFVGSIAENVSAYAEVPVLTYNIGKKKISKSTKPITREKILWSRKNREKA